MLKKFHCLVYLIALLFSLQSTQAQIKVKLANSEYTIPIFNTDTLTSKTAFIAEDSLLKLHHYIKPIRLSKFKLEVRCFYQLDLPFDIFRMIVLKGTEKKLWVEEYYLRKVYLLTDNTPGIKLNNQSSIAIEIN